MTTQSLERELSARQSNLHQLQAMLDESVEAGNEAEVIRLQGEIAAAEQLLQSTLRRIEKAKAGASDAEKAAKRKANTEAAELVAKSLREDVALVGEIEATLARLVEQLHALREHGTPAGSAVQSILKQLPETRRENYQTLAHDASNTDTRVAVLIESALQRFGVFDTLAPHPALRLTRHDLPTLVEDYTYRAERLGTAVARLAEQVNVGIK